MALLRVANIHFNSTGTANISFVASNIVRISANAMTVPRGTTANRPTPEAGIIRYNTDSNNFESYNANAWSAIVTGVIDFTPVTTISNLAYDKANTSYNYAANTVQLIANSAFAAQNTTYTYAANTVQLIANSAFAAQNTTYTYAANTVKLIANSAYASANAAIKNNVSTIITVGYGFTTYSLGTGSGTVTLNPALGNYQSILNNGAFTIASPSSPDFAIDLYVYNGASAGTLSFSGFGVQAGGTGDPYNTNNGYAFFISFRRIGSYSTYIFKAVNG